MDTLLRFRSSYRGQSEYQVLRGGMKGKIVSVRYLRHEWYQKDFEDNVGRVFGNDPTNYHREVMTSVGLVCCSGHQIDDDIVVAVNALFSPLQRQYPELYYQGIFLPGKYVAGVGWQIDIDRPALDDIAMTAS